jgi:hypothetical protein
MSIGGIVWSMPPGGARTGIGYAGSANITVTSGAAPFRGQNARQHTSGFGAAICGPGRGAVSIASIQRGFVRAAQLHAPRSTRGLMNMLMGCAAFTLIGLLSYSRCLSSSSVCISSTDGDQWSCAVFFELRSGYVPM